MSNSKIEFNELFNQDWIRYQKELEEKLYYIKKYPKKFKNWWGARTTAYYFTRRDIKEIEDFDTDDKYYKDNVEYMYYKASTNIYLDNFNEAKKICKKMLKLDPNCIDAYSKLAQCQTKLKEYNKAIKTIDTALDIFKDDKYLYFQRGVIKLFAGLYNEAIMDLNKAKSFYKKIPTGNYLIALCLIKLGKYRKARNIILKLLEKYESDTDYIQAIAIIEYYLKNYDEAKKYYSRCIKNNTTDLKIRKYYKALENNPKSTKSLIEENLDELLKLKDIDLSEILVCQYGYTILAWGMFD